MHTTTFIADWLTVKLPGSSGQLLPLFAASCIESRKGGGGEGGVRVEAGHDTRKWELINIRRVAVKSHSPPRDPFKI